MICKLFLRCFLPLLLFSSLCHAEPVDIASLLDELKRASAKTETLSSRFVQEKHLSIFSETLLSQGLFAYRKADRLRWELLTPIASGFVLQGDHGERWNSLSREKSRFSVENDPIMSVVVQQLLAWARIDVDWLQSRYRMELQSVKPISLHLFPLDTVEATLIDHLQILFDADRQHIAEVLIVERQGDSTLLRFTDVIINAELPAETFQAPEFR